MLLTRSVLVRERFGEAPVGDRRWMVCGRGVVLVITAAVLLAGCGASRPEPMSVPELASAFMPSNPGRYRSVLTATGHGTRRFAGVSLPHQLSVEISCRGGRAVRAQIAGRDWVEVFCAAGQSGGSTETFPRPSSLTIVATPNTRWSLLVEARQG